MIANLTEGGATSGTALLKLFSLEPRDSGSESLRVPVGLVACLYVPGPWSDCAEVCTVSMRCLSLSDIRL